MKATRYAAVALTLALSASGSGGNRSGPRLYNTQFRFGKSLRHD